MTDTKLDIDIPAELERRERQYERIRQKLAVERQDVLDELFHIDDKFARESPQEAAQLKAQFLEAKEGLNLGECFNLSLEDPYFGRVYLVKLASTDHTMPDASQKLFRETNEFLALLAQHGLAENEADDGHISRAMGDDEIHDAIKNGEDPGRSIDRLRSGRWMEYELIDDEDGRIDHQVALIRRFRPFVVLDVKARGRICSLRLYKETAFTIRAIPLLELIANQDRSHGTSEEALGWNVFPAASQPHDQKISNFTMERIETWLYTPEGGNETVQLHRLHTAIYSAIQPLPDKESMRENES